MLAPLSPRAALSISKSNKKMDGPIYEQHSCPLCKNYVYGRCSDCGKQIPTESEDRSYKNMNGSGFSSHTADHRHIKPVKGDMGLALVTRELCLECVRVDFKKVYPHLEHAL